MTRLASTAKAGFFPTPGRVTEWIAHCVLPTSSGGRLLDPCCGEGIAAQTVSQAWHLEGYGIEIDAERVLEASGRLHRVLHLDCASARAPHHAFQVLYLNPPYDAAEGEGKRTEYTFLRDTTKWLQPGGLIVYIVPQYRVDARLAGYLATVYESIRAYRFPDPEYAQFRQAVIFGIAKAEPRRDEQGALALLQHCRAGLPVLLEEMGEEEKYHLPAPLETKFYFRGTEINPQEALAEATEAGAWKTPEWQEWMTPRRDLATFRPLMPLKKGHLAMLIAAGLMQNLRLRSEDGTEQLLVKGRTYKVQEKVESADEDEEIVRDRFVTEIVALDLKSGKNERVADPPALAEFVDKWRDALTKKVMDTFVPLYQFDLEAEGSVVPSTLANLSRHRHVPGRKETGLFAAQKHVAVALWKRLQKSNSAILVGEMGTGKCVLPDTRIQVNGELISAADTWQRYANEQSAWSDGEGVWCKSKEPLWVPSFNERVARIELRRVSRLYRQHVREKVRQVRLADGSSVTVTQSHPFLTPHGWTNSVQVGDYVAVPLHVPSPCKASKVPVPVDFMAWQIAEGYEQQDPATLRVYQKDESVLTHLLGEAEFLQAIPGFRSQPAIRRHPGECPFLEVSSTSYVKYLHDNGYVWGCRSASKSIPPFVMRASRDSVRSFLQAYADAEGYAGDRGIELMTASEQLSHQVVELLRRLGVRASVHPKIAYAANTLQQTRRLYYRIMITGDSARRFRDQVGFGKRAKEEQLAALCAKSVNSSVETIYVADIVKSVRRAAKLGRKVSGNLLGHVYATGKEPTMNRAQASRLLEFIDGLLSGELESRYKQLKHHNYRSLVARLQSVIRSELEGARNLLRRRLNQEIQFSRVLEIREIAYVGMVYDLEVEKTHNFVANQILVHNTTISSAVSELIRCCDGDTRPTLILCPPHLVNKWIREIQQIVPMAFAMPLYRLTDVTQFVNQLGRLAPGTPAYAVLSREMAKLGSGWRPAYVIRHRYTRVSTRRGDSFVEKEQFFACPRCGYPVYETEGGHEVTIARDPSYLEERKRYCSQCREPLFQMMHLNGATVSEEARLLEADTRPTTSRYPIAEFIARRHRGLFKLLIADEVHQMKGQSTDQGYALGSLVRACSKTLALTGTIFGGRATSLFFLLHRLSPVVRAQFKWTDGQRWAERFGILEKVMKRSEGDDGFGTYSGKRRRQTYVRELPGASPELVALLLDSSAFLSLTDLGFQLPAYREYPHEIPMAKDQREAYDALEEELMEELQDRLKAGDHSLLAAYLQSLLAYPNSCFREEVVEDTDGEVVASAPALGENRLYPKEEWLVNLARKERDLGRRVLVFCRQTGTRDITERLARLLGRAGLRVDILKASVGTQVREEWLRRRVGKGMIDVLITNPKLVEVGLDLVDFQTTVWFESEYSLVRRTTA